ncbi:hypothetical protein BDW69DRAFT_181043 [Aspergillus filifer]
MDERHFIEQAPTETELVKMLLEKGARSDLKTFDKNQTPLALAVARALTASDGELTGEKAEIEQMSPAKATVTRPVKGSSPSEKHLIVRTLDEEGSIDKVTSMLEIATSEAEESKLIWFASRPTKHEGVTKILNQRQTETTAKTPLKLAAFHGLIKVVWWLLATTDKSEKDVARDRKSAAGYAETRKVSYKNLPKKGQAGESMGQDLSFDKSRIHAFKLTYGRRDRSIAQNPEGGFDALSPPPAYPSLQEPCTIILDLLKNPPLVKGRSVKDEPYEQPKLDLNLKDKIKEIKSTIVDFYCHDEGVDFLWRSRGIDNVIYSPANRGGPEKIMDEARRTLKEIDSESLVYGSQDIKLRWIHLPANNMPYLTFGKFYEAEEPHLQNNAGENADAETGTPYEEARKSYKKLLSAYQNHTIHGTRPLD